MDIKERAVIATPDRTNVQPFQQFLAHVKANIKNWEASEARTGFQFEAKSEIKKLFDTANSMRKKPRAKEGIQGESLYFDETFSASLGECTIVTPKATRTLEKLTLVSFPQKGSHEDPLEIVISQMEGYHGYIISVPLPKVTEKDFRHTETFYFDENGTMEAQSDLLANDDSNNRQHQMQHMLTEFMDVPYVVGPKNNLEWRLDNYSQELDRLDNKTNLT